MDTINEMARELSYLEGKQLSIKKNLDGVALRCRKEYNITTVEQAKMELIQLKRIIEEKKKFIDSTILKLANDIQKLKED